MSIKKGNSIKGGRPSTYRPEYCQQVIKLMEKGYSKQAVAGSLGINRDTLYHWCATILEFSDSIKIGEAKSALYWESIGMDGALGKVKGFSPAVWIFIMKNRFGWRDNLNIEETKIESKTLIEQEDPDKALLRIVQKYGPRLTAKFTPIKST